MKYIKVYCLESRFSNNDILLDFDYIKNEGDRYVVVSDGSPQTSFPILPNHAIKPVKSYYVADEDVAFVFFKYLKEV